MNFIGHATVALWWRGEPRFVLGSMLPDFAGMTRSRLAHPETPAARSSAARALVEGIALHHETDDAFHGAPTFTTLVQATIERLSELGVGRGAARAVGHVGVELLLDGELLGETQVGEAYIEALRAGEEAGSLFADEAGATRWEGLRRRLLAHGPPHDYRDPECVVARLGVILGARPRLALDAAAAQIVRATLPSVQQQVRTNRAALLAEVRSRLTPPTWSMPDGYFP